MDILAPLSPGSLPSPGKLRRAIAEISRCISLNRSKALANDVGSYPEPEVSVTDVPNPNKALGGGRSVLVEQ